MNDNAWTLSYQGFDPDSVGLREALCTLGNGVFCTRGAAEETSADGVHYPGTYIAGGYNRAASEVSGRDIVNEDLVNFPNWLCLTFRPANGEWLYLGQVEILDYHLELRFKEGVLHRRMRVRDGMGRETTVESRRIVSMAWPHIAAISYSITPENWSGRMRLRSSLDGSVQNTGVARYRQLNSRHLEVLELGPVAPEGIFLVAQTLQSRFQVALAARTRLFLGDDPFLESESRIQEGRRAVHQEFMLDIPEGVTLTAEKVVALHTSRDRGITEAGLDARLAVRRAPGFADLLQKHREAWGNLWRRCDLELETRTEPTGEHRREQMILRLHIFHLLQTASPHTTGRDASIPARGWHGEAYRGHIFWDELFILPFYNLRLPAIARSLLVYRWYRLWMARELALEAGRQGAMFPWQSSSDGREETQQVHLNPLSGSWDPDHSRLQRHINIAIIYNIWQYWEVSGDLEFMDRHGTQMMLEISRFWSSATTFNEERGRYEIHGVMGPDEYHEKYPDAETGGLSNNTYTNVMTVWCLERTLEALNLVRPIRRAELLEHLGIEEKELERWGDITRRMYVHYLDREQGIFSQFEGYENLEELDWEGYRAKYGDIHRLDRILKAEGDSPDRYQVSKQADVTMLFYLLTPKELRDLLDKLGYPFDDATIERNVRYYEPRTSHGSTLSQVVYASILDRIDRTRGWTLFREALRSDIDDIQGGTTPEGIHVAAMAGTVDIVLRHYAGIDTTAEAIAFTPQLPEQLKGLHLRVKYKGVWLELDITASHLEVTVEKNGARDVPVLVEGRLHRLVSGEKRRFELAT